MRKAAVCTIAFSLAWIVSSFTIGEAKADHGHEELAVQECQAFEFVLEADDQLYLCRQNAVELDHATTSDDLGTSGVLLVIEENGSAVELSNIPRMGYGMTGIYFRASDLTAPTFATTTVDVYLTQNPSFFASPVESARVDVVFNESTSSLDTQDLLTVVVAQMIVRLEFDDPDISTGTLLSGSGITDAGRVYVEEAFQELLILIPEAFNFPLTTVIPELEPGSAPVFLQQIQAQGRETYFAKSIVTWGELFGFGYTTTVLIGNFLTVAFLLFILYLLQKRGWPVNFKAAYFSIIPLLLLDAFIDALGFDVALIFIDFVFIIGAGMIANRHIPS